ncbi:MAG: hypothetical protein ACRELU_02925 [Gemmatimonadota bacterium]
MTDPVFDPLRMLDVLDRHGVRFVMIGGLAGRLWGSPTVTNDLDVCHARDRANLRRLAEALRELNARLRGVAEDVPFLLDDRTLAAGDHFTFVTDSGNLDCLGIPAGTNGYEDLAKTAERMEIAGRDVLVAAIEDLIRMKLAAGRPKDRIEAEILGAVREEIEHEEG